MNNNNINNLVSVIMPTYNSSAYVTSSIDSILKQSYTNFELLICDDCSTDNTLEILNHLSKKDSRIRVFKLHKNSGSAVARNYAISESKGRFIAFCDSDDKWLTDKLKIQLDFMLKNNYHFTYSYYIVNENDTFKCIRKSPHILNYQTLLKKNYIGCLTAMYDVYFVGKIYMPLLRNRQDWGFWLLIIQKTKLAFCIDQELGIYSIRSSSISRNKFKLVKYHYRIYKDVLSFNKLKSLLYLVLNLFYEYKFKIFNS